MNQLSALPFVSVIVPALNEEDSIVACLDSLLDNDYPSDRMELLVIDGMSVDRTRELVRQVAARDGRVRLLDNPRRHTPVALNLGIKASRGDIVVRMDAHATVAPTYLRLAAEALRTTEAVNVGGQMVTIPGADTLVGRAIALAISHPFGVGPSRFRTGVRKPMWVDTVFGGCYRRSVFEESGLFNEDLPRGQDLEFNRRITRPSGFDERLVRSEDMEFNRRLTDSGRRILLLPEMVAYYRARPDLRSFAIQTWKNGVWSTKPFAFSHGSPVGLRHLVPTFAVIVLTLLTVIAFALNQWWPLVALLGTYVAIASSVGISSAVRGGDWRLGVVVPALIAILHAGYGVGGVVGSFAALRELARRSTLIRLSG